ncbi:MAG: protein kinase [Acidobacteria bacterium]|nr:protein kinase [Acidobacteriota bacterium]
MIFQKLSHYHILEKLGAGGMGEVYLAEDTKLGRKVAVKLLPAAFTTDQERVRRFEQEARAASALNHPNIITIHEIGEAEAGRFIVMEYVRGNTLRSIAGERPVLGSLAEFGRQIARALCVAHAAGIIHRDIKPENIMVREDGYVKVLDFGLARLAPQNILEIDSDNLMASTPGSLIGTALYMSPEQTRGERLGSASDIFALGVVFYELATGQHPFKGTSTFALLQAITSLQVPPPSRINPEISSPLDHLILQMLERDPQLRPTAENVERAFAEITKERERGSGRAGERENWLSGDHVPPAIPFPLAPALSGSRSSIRKIVGREKEVAELRAGFELARNGRGLVLCIAGEPGIGKTALVEDFLNQLMTGDQLCRVARGRCSERLAGTEAYLPWLEALDNLLHSEVGESMARTMRVGTDSPGRLMRLLAPTWYLQVAPLSLDTSSEARLITDRTAASQERLKLELCAYLQEVSKSRPLVLFFDDLHWSDTSTIDLLTYIAGKLETLRLLIVVTYRSSDLILAKHPFLQIKSDLQARGICREITLQFLIRAEIERYLALQFPGHRFPEELPSLIQTKTEGNPLFMTDLVRYLCDRRVIAQENGRWILGGSLAQIEREVPESVRGMIERKVSQLGEEDCRLLISASVQGSEFDSAVVAEALKMDPAEVEERLECLERIHAFIKLVGEKDFPDHTLTLRYRFVHVLYQNAFYSRLRPTRRIALSGAMAQALLSHYGDKSTAVASTLAHLLSIARNFGEAAHYYMIASRAAADVFAYEEASTLARRGLEMLKMSPEDPERAQQEMALQLTLGTSLSFSRGHSLAEAGKSMSRARELCQQMGDPPQLFTSSFALWSFYIVGAKLGDARQMAEQLLRMAEQANDPLLLLGGHYTLGTTLQFLGELPLGHEHLEHAISYYDQKKSRVYRAIYTVDPGVFCLCEMVRTLWLLGYPDQAGRRLDEALELGRVTDDPQGMAFALVKAVYLHSCRRDARAAEEWAVKCLHHCQEHGIMQDWLWVRSLSGWALATQGKVKEAMAQMRESIDSYRALHSDLSLSHYLTILADVLGFTGNPEEGLSVISEALEVAGRTGDRHCEAETLRVRGELQMILSAGGNSGMVTEAGDWLPVTAPTPVCIEAEDSFRKAIEIAHRQGAKSWELRAAICLSRLLLQLGKREEARDSLAPVYNWFTEGFDTADLREARALLDELS